MNSARFIKIISLAVALFTVIAMIPYSSAATELNTDIPLVKVESLDELNVVNSAPVDVDTDVSQSYGLFPSKYSSVEKGFVTVPKDQGQNGTCWAFAAASMAETSVLANGGTYGGNQADVDKINFSEAQIAYFTYAGAYDPLGNLNGDGTYIDTDNLLSYGGNHYFTTLAFASWKGLCEDYYMPYDKFVDKLGYEYDPRLGYKSSVRLENAYWLNMSEVDAVKELIINNGAVLTDYFHDDSFFNMETGAYYCSDPYRTNHAITLVGWDDNYSRENFLCQPASDGAWLVKNSWGEEWGNDGYFWLSYCDATVKNSEATTMQFMDSDKYDNNYQYDGSCIMSYVGLNSGMVLANSFTVSADEKEKLEAVSFGIYSSNVDYSIRIIKNSTDFEYLNGEELLSEPVTGHASYSGYYTVPLEEDIVLEKGDEYTVCIKFTTEDDSPIFVLADHSEVMGDMSFVNNIENDRSYYGQDYGKETTLAPLGLRLSSLVEDNRSTARIKAFTTNVEHHNEDDDDNSFWEDIFYWFHTIINGIDTSHKAGEKIELLAEFYLDENGYAHRFVKWVCDKGNLDIDENSAEISFVMPDSDIELHAEYIVVGDVNDDETINAFDALEMRKEITFSETDECNPASDINGDGRVNAIDVVALNKFMGNKYEIIK
ncbi:MAG: hypothetical protein IKL36_03790 [Clostridia bacterium]|nr:hypothetical protein [Clostridia bacterium]